MDSCNSGSMSSSGGDDEYDSRAESSISAFLSNNNNPLTHVGPMPNPPPPPQPPPPDHHHHQHQSHHHSMFDPSSNFFDPLSSSSSSSRSSLTTNPNSLVNLDMVWSKNLRSEANCTDLGGLIAASSSPTQQFFTNQTQTRPTFNPSIQIPQVPETTTTTARGPGLASGSSDHQTTNTGNMVRNPKKRSRASRRAPTTVLTTDTSNFRAMVQEFTGIPAPPFTSSPFPRSRLDLFGTCASSSLRSLATQLEPSQPSYLLRPFAQKIQPPFLSPSNSSMIDAIASTSTATTSTSTSTTTNINNATTTTTCSSDLGLLKYPHNLLNINMQNPILNFHSLLQPSHKYPLPNSPILGTTDTTKPQQQQQGPPSLDIPSSNDSHLKMGVLEEFGLSHGHVSNNLTWFQNIVPSSDTTLRRSDRSNNNNNTSSNNNSNWGDGIGPNEGDLLRSINGNYNNNNSNTQRVVANNNHGKVNYSSSSSDFHRGDKEPETNVNVVANTRSEGMVESWICSSD